MRTKRTWNLFHLLKTFIQSGVPLFLILTPQFAKAECISTPIYKHHRYKGCNIEDAKRSFKLDQSFKIEKCLNYCKQSREKTTQELKQFSRDIASKVAQLNESKMESPAAACSSGSSRDDSPSKTPCSTSPAAASSSSDAAPSKRAFHLTPKQLEKYTNKKVKCLKLGDPVFLSQLKTAYHKLKIPKFIDDLMRLNEDAESVRIYRAHPETISWTKDQTFILQMNPPQLSDLQKQKISTPTELKEEEGGLSLIGYYYHPNLINYSRFYNQPGLGLRTNLPIRLDDVSRRTYQEIEDKKIPYMVSILDLKKEDLEYLKEIRTLIHEKLRTNYGVTAEDQVKLYFHFPYDPATTSLHLHVRVNQGSHGMEKARIFHLDDVIDALEHDRSVTDLITEQISHNHGCIYFVAPFKKGPGCQLPENVDKPECYPPLSLNQELGKLDPPIQIEELLVDNPFSE